MSTVLCIAALCVIALLLVILFCIAAPLAIHLEFMLGKEEPEADFGMYWVHPKVVSVSLDKDANPVFSIFGKKRTIADEPHQPSDPLSVVEPLKKNPPSAHLDIPKDHTSSKQYQMPSDSSETETTANSNNKQESFWSSTKSKFRKLRITIRKNRMIYLLRQTSWRTSILRWLRHSIPRFFKIISLKKCDLQIAYGSEDPATTGMVYGWILALNGILVPRRIAVRMTPYFNTDELSGTGTILFKTSIARIMHPAICALITFPWVHTWILWSKAQKHYKTFSAMEVAPHAEHS